jgi:hypothetical protein
MASTLTALAHEHLQGMDPQKVAAEWLLQKMTDVLPLRQAELMLGISMITSGTANDVLRVFHREESMAREGFSRSI